MSACGRDLPWDASKSRVSKGPEGRCFADQAQQAVVEAYPTPTADLGDLPVSAKLVDVGTLLDRRQWIVGLGYPLTQSETNSAALDRPMGAPVADCHMGKIHARPSVARRRSGPCRSARSCGLPHSAGRSF